MTIDEIRKLIEIVRDTGIAELEVQWDKDRVRIVGTSAASKEVILPTVLPVSIAGAAPQAAVQPPVAGQPLTPPAVAPPAFLPEEELTVLVKSPIVGTYYDSPSPGEPSFVRVGDTVELKQVLCIIESMKLMNEIEADVAGTIVEKHVENGRPVEYGEALFTLRPL